MQVRAHVGEVVNTNFEPTCHATQHLAHGAIVTAHRQGACSPAARENEMHRASRADGTLQLALSASHVAAVLCSRKLDLDPTIEKRPLHHQSKVSIV
jgi:hypothetical protein